jgi:hypothetical protein
MAGTRAVIAAAAVLLAGPTLAGCSGGDPVPKVEPSSSDSGSASASEPPTAHLSPTETVRAWLMAQNRALHSGDVSELRGFAARGCRGCGDFVRAITDVYNRGGYYRGGNSRLVGAQEKGPATGPVTIHAAVVTAAGVTVERRGANALRYGEDRAIMDFRVVLHAGTWLIDYIGFVQ